MRDSAERRRQPVENPRLKELRRKHAVASLRVWLAGLDADARRVRAQYVRWQVGTGYAPASSFDRHGGFTKLKQEAAGENARVRRAGQDPLAEARARADSIRAEVDAIYPAGRAHQPQPVSFADALRTVLTGPHAEVQAPLQTGGAAKASR